MSTVIFSIILAVALAASSNFGFISASNRCISFTSVSALASFSRPVQNDQPATTRNEITSARKETITNVRVIVIQKFLSSIVFTLSRRKNRRRIGSLAKYSHVTTNVSRRFDARPRSIVLRTDRNTNEIGQRFGEKFELDGEKKKRGRVVERKTTRNMQIKLSFVNRIGSTVIGEAATNYSI